MKHKIFICLTMLILGLSSAGIYAQSRLTGQILDEGGEPVFLANIAIKGVNIGTMTNELGVFSLRVPGNENLDVVISCVGYKTQELSLELINGETREIEVVLEEDITEIDEVSVSARQERATSFRSIDINSISLLPNTTGSIETIIKTLPGVSSNNELSS
ncbi:MAG: carboxypeptidase-like regulatory domain-containing protein, partial [Bacteroidales bacterium]